MPPLIDGKNKPRPVQLYECAKCHKDIADEAVPIAVRVAAFVVPKASRDRALEIKPFDITDVGIPEIIRELVDQEKHPDGHVYLGLGCFQQLLGPEFKPVNADGLECVSIVPMRAVLDALGITNEEFTGREHRPPEEAASVVELFDKNGVRVNPDGTPWVPPVPSVTALPAPSSPPVDPAPAAPAPAPAPTPAATAPAPTS